MRMQQASRKETRERKTRENAELARNRIKFDCFGLDHLGMCRCAEDVGTKRFMQKKCVSDAIETRGKMQSFIYQAGEESCEAKSGVECGNEVSHDGMQSHASERGACFNRHDLQQGVYAAVHETACGFGGKGKARACELSQHHAAESAEVDAGRAPVCLQALRILFHWRQDECLREAEGMIMPCPYCFDWEGMPMGLENGTCPVCGYEDENNDEGESFHGRSDDSDKDAGDDEL